MTKTTAPNKTPSADKQTINNPVRDKQAGSVFFSLATEMTLRLAVIVLVPIIGGVELDKVLKTSPLLLIIGLVLAAVGSFYVMRSITRKANSLPVPKLTDDQKREIQKKYEEEDNE